MLEAFLKQLIKIADAIVKIPPLLEDLVQQQNQIRLTLTQIEERLMDLNPSLEGVDEPVNELAPESAERNGNGNH